MRTLILDATFYPVKVVDWQKALLLIFTGRAEIVTEYNDRYIQATHTRFKLPKILRLFGRHQGHRRVKFSRANVFWRDKYTCQYCNIKSNYKDLTFDHVIPQSRGGGTNWTNIVTCCAKCNTRKGDKLPHEARMFPNKRPREPKWTPQLCLKLKQDDPSEWKQWFPTYKQPA